MRTPPVRTSAPSRLHLRLLLACACFLATALLCDDARAYTWMIRHDYTGCGTCHLDPSGGGILTPYGRAVGGLILDTRYVDRTDEESRSGEFLLGLVTLPPWLMLGGDLRTLYYSSKVESVPTQDDFFVMQADLEAALKVEHVLASVSVGYAETGAYAAAVTRAPEKNLVSRVHWLGYEFDAESALLVRAGRMNLPFGVRNVEHTLWTRAHTRTSINADQQHGFAVAWAPGPLRAELMAVLGNFQLRPDDYRERGYSGYVEWSILPSLAIGVSSLVTHAELDAEYLRETWRQAHGGFVRWASGWKPLVLLAEGNYALRSPKQDFRRSGFVGALQIDLEPVQGLHYVVTGETSEVGVQGTRPSWGLWLSQLWFVAPHTDVRIDGVFESLGDEFGRSQVLTLLAQAHLYL
jgi:hypothetical protein